MPPEPHSTGQKETFQNDEILVKPPVSTFSTTRKNFSCASGSWHRIWNGTDRELFLFHISDKGIISFLKASKFNDCSSNLIIGFSGTIDVKLALHLFIKFKAELFYEYFSHVDVLLGVLFQEYWVSNIVGTNKEQFSTFAHGQRTLLLWRPFDW